MESLTPKCLLFYNLHSTHYDVSLKSFLFKILGIFRFLCRYYYLYQHFKKVGQHFELQLCYSLKIYICIVVAKTGNAFQSNENHLGKTV